MDSELFSSYYQELSLLQVKYEHLTEINRSLLKPWPLQSASEDQADHKKEVNNGEVPEQQAKELEQLDMLLNKAQKLRVGRNPEEEDRLSKKSIKLASSVYKPNHSTDHSTKPAKVASRAAHSASRPGQARAKHRSKQAAAVGQSKSLATLLDHAGRAQKHSVAAKSEPKDANDRKMRVEREALLPSDNTHEPQGFSLVREGTRLSMAGKYSRLHRLASRCSEVLTQEEGGEPGLPASRAAAAHFSRRLLAKRDKDCRDQIRLQLCVDHFEQIKERLASIPPREWIVSERSQWEDLLFLRTKLELLTQHYQAASALCSRKPPSSPWRGHGRTPDGSRAREEEDGGLLREEEFAYSSLREWSALTDAWLRERYLRWEGRYLQQLQETVVPLTCQLAASGPRHVDSSRHMAGSRHVDNGSRHVDKDDVSGVVAMIRGVHLASNTKTCPSYLNTDSLTHQNR